MEDQQGKKLKGYSKFLSYVLRHRPSEIGLVLDEAGYADVEQLLRRSVGHKHAQGLSRALLEEVVATNNKKRFDFSVDGTKIRARQGHSVEVALGNESVEPPECLYHGTSTKSVDGIKASGLLKMTRHAVHLSPNFDTARVVGQRRGKPVVIKIRARQMHSDGFVFFLTANGVWYTAHVPKKYLLWPEEREYQTLGAQGVVLNSREQ